MNCSIDSSGRLLDSLNLSLAQETRDYVGATCELFIAARKATRMGHGRRNAKLVAGGFVFRLTRGLWRSPDGAEHERSTAIVRQRMRRQSPHHPLCGQKLNIDRGLAAGGREYRRAGRS